MSVATRRDLSKLERSARTFGAGLAGEKVALIARLEPRQFAEPKLLLRFHEALSLIRAYPDDEQVLEQVTAALERFGERADVGRHRKQLVDSGVAGTAIHFPFHWATACWLARRWPERLRIDWPALTTHAALERVLPRLLGWAEAVEPGATRARLRQYLELFERPGEADGTFLVRRFQGMRAAPSLREHFFESLELPLVLLPAPGGPTRTSAALSGAPLAWQRTPLLRTRPNFRRGIDIPPLSVRWVRGTDADRIIDLARVAMISRNRDLDAIKHGNRDDVRIVDAGEGLSFACIGVLPEQRSLLETLYVFLVIKNGVPIGYYQAALLFGCAELNFNIFPTWRGGEAASIYVRGAAMVRHLFGVDTFAVPPYQLGHENEEALSTGAFWFYAKLGFRPADRAIRSVLGVELAALRADPGHRSARSVLRKLANGYLYFQLGRPRDDVAGKLSLDAIAHAVSRMLNQRYGSDRERATKICQRQAQTLLGVSPSRWSTAERLAWERWAPLVLSLPGFELWPAHERRAVAALIRAKGGLVEQRFNEKLDHHARLRRSILALARSHE